MSNDLIIRLQPFMRKSKVYEALFDIQLNELNDRSIAINDLEKQLTISTATWALEIYERATGLPVDSSKPLSERRSRIKAKLRGVGKVDSELIKSVVSSWTGGTTEVEFDNGTITIRFIDSIGIPENMSDVQIALEEIKPAHLAILFVFIYNSWATVSLKTWGELELFTWEEVLSSNIN